MSVIEIEARTEDADYSSELCRKLEQGYILLLSPTPFLPPAEDCDFLRDQRQVAAAAHKNIAYKPHLRRVSGAAVKVSEDAERLQRILACYSEGAVTLLSTLFPHYAKSWRVDYASFRPVEEKDRNLPIKHRNDLMHLDAFPTRPTHGGRILRAFTNLHPTRERVWATAEPFQDLAARYARDAGLGRVTGPLAEARRKASRLGRLVGARVPDRSPYDEFMLRFHHWLKLNADFQQHGRAERAVFPPGATWISFTDQVAHAVESGQYALEQTCIVPYEAMLQPELAPVSVLEKLAGRKLISPRAVRASKDARG